MLSWTEQKVKRATVASGGSTIADAFGAAFPVPLGRMDADSADDAVKIPTQSASPAEVKVSGGKRKGHVHACTDGVAWHVCFAIAPLHFNAVNTASNMCHALLYTRDPIYISYHSVLPFAMNFDAARCCTVLICGTCKL